jgi:hypothetical protein
MGNISRKNFLRKMGSIVAGGSIAGVSGVVISKNLKSENPTQPHNDNSENPASPYKPTVVFTAPGGTVEAFDCHNGKLYAAGNNTITVMDDYGKTLARFDDPNGLTRDMAVDETGIYLLRPDAVTVYSHHGEPIRQWEACSSLSDYCSMALAGEFLFVTDRDNKNICKYTRQGEFKQFIESPNRFIIPSLTFGIAYAGGNIYCANSGRHQVEIYSLEGNYKGKFGAAGSGQGHFCGCCNPTHLAATPNGEIITSEKGSPRISCYSPGGNFQSTLINNKMLGTNTAASKVKVAGAKLFTACADKITVYEYDPQLAATGSCSGCGVNCLLRNS